MLSVYTILKFHDPGIQYEPVFLPHLAINSRNEIYLAVADARTPTPGLRIFDAVTDHELTTTPLNVGRSPPVWTLFTE